MPIILKGIRYTFEFKELPDDDPLVPLLDACVSKHIGGIVPLSKEEYDVKKKSTTKPNSLHGMPREEVNPKYLPLAKSAVVADPAGTKRVNDNAVIQSPDLAAISQDMSAFVPKAQSGVFL